MKTSRAGRHGDTAEREKRKKEGGKKQKRRRGKKEGRTRERGFRERKEAVGRVLQLRYNVWSRILDGVGNETDDSLFA